MCIATGICLFASAGCSTDTERSSEPDGVWIVETEPEDRGHQWGHVEETGEFFDDFVFSFQCRDGDNTIDVLFENHFDGHPFGLEAGTKFRLKRELSNLPFDPTRKGYYIYADDIEQL
ncbi:hypothetical protein [Rhodopirellula baltica]|uniref:Uncharacterized protein n=1 Tax=Rhodopirellula baltica SWK14 TaxID=993516 RepID=L7CKU8_RHOBT|nr:hypothetical protein [Rhodopirellula baltica]ELP33686.1 hypothetical protein RBSWK_02374 [Rhodopirellula baltica SWK14]